MVKDKKIKKYPLIRNSTAEFLTFTGQSGEKTIEARYEDETVWLTQKLISTLFDVGLPTVNEHLKNIYDQGEIAREATIRKFRTVQTEGKRAVARNVDFYNLDAIISVGYRVNSVRATQFRQWATRVLREFAIKGYVLDKKRMENGSLEDWAKRLDVFLEFDDREILKNSGKVTAEIARAHAESEFEKYRVVQDRLFESDFDKAVKKIEQEKKGKTDNARKKKNK